MGQTYQAFRTQTDVPVGVDVTRGEGVPGLTIAYKIFNGANQTEFLDFNDGTFKAAGHTTPTQNLTEVSAIEAPGVYEVTGGFDLSAITIPAATTSLRVFYEITAGGEVGSEWDTIQIVDQVIRDAMKLAPSAGAPVAGSVDQHLDDIEADTAAMEPLITANLDAAISSVVAAIAALNDLSQADVQTAMTTQGYTTARAALLDNLDAAVTAVLTAIGGLNDLSSADVTAVLDAQGLTSVRAALLDNLDAAISAVLSTGGTGPWTTGITDPVAVARIGEIWQRLGLDIANDVTHTDVTDGTPGSIVVGAGPAISITLTKTGNTVVTTRTP